MSLLGLNKWEIGYSIAAQCQALKSPWYGAIIQRLPRGTKLSDYVTSLYVEARKAVARSHPRGRLA